MIDLDAIKARKPYVTETDSGARQYFNTASEVEDFERRAANATASGRYGRAITVRRVRWNGINL